LLEEILERESSENREAKSENMRKIKGTKRNKAKTKSYLE